MSVSVHALPFPIFAKWYITGRCNLRCSHCYLTDYRQQADIERVKSIISYLARKGVIHISFLGGEPLARPDMFDIARHAVEHGVKCKIATNGTLVTEDVARSFAALDGVSFQISLEGHSPELSDPVRGSGTFHQALEGLRRLKNWGHWSAISMTISALNFDKLPQMVRLADDHGADSIKLAAFVPVGTGSQSARHLMLDDDALQTVRTTLPELQAQYPHIFFDSAFLPADHGNIAQGTRTFGCGAGTTSIVINNDLSVSACDILTEEDRTDVRINEPEDIDRLWNHQLFRKWRSLEEGSTRTIPDFKDVHLKGCHVATTLYGKNILNGY